MGGAARPRPPAVMPATNSDLSRRALLAGGLLRSVRARFDEQIAEPEPPRAPAPPRWTAEEWTSLAARGAPCVPPLLDALALEPGTRLLDVAAVDGPLANAASERGAEVVRAHPRVPTLPHEDASVDAAGSLFGIVHAKHVRGMGRELERVLRPGGRLALLTWASGGALGELLRLARGSRRVGRADARPERWGAYEGLMLALERFPGFEVQTLPLTWRFADPDGLWGAVSLPEAVFSDDQRPLVEARLQPFVQVAEGALELRVDACLVTAIRPR
jgi:SAM-dependent methyltransferase